jgi:glycosyltransferase involved in cell wall biosynthesis
MGLSECGSHRTEAQGTGLAPAAGFAPRVSVAVRSFRRLPQLLELLRALLAQRYPNFEIVVIEQTGAERERFRKELAVLEQDPRLRLLSYEPLGAGPARIEAVRQCDGEIIVFMDDDDLPCGDEWLTAFVENFRDPHCMGVSGRQIFQGEADDGRHDTERNRRRCLRYTFLRMPSGRVRHRARVVGVTQVSGGNAALRASAISRAGGWDPEDDHDEDSFCFRFERVRQAGDYFVYDPKALMLRRLDVPGGLARRAQSLGERMRSELRYSHRVVRKYYPWRFFLFYPCYLWLAGLRAFAHVRRWQPELAWQTLLLELVCRAPAVYLDTHSSLSQSG